MDPGDNSHDRLLPCTFQKSADADMTTTTLLLTALLLTGGGSAAVTVDELHQHYGDIFVTNNRNAASHLWASWVLNRAATLSKASVEQLFSGFCPVSGSPVSPTDYNAYHYTLRSLVPGEEHASGLMHHCCAPCVCDTQDMMWADTKTVDLADGSTALTFAVIGDPCQHAATLERPFTDPFSGGQTTLAATAPEVQCGKDGKLKGATYSDHGGVIIGLLRTAPAPSTAAPAEPTPGRITTVGAVHFQDSREYAGFCVSRASQGYNSGMGMIFRKVAEITRLTAAATAATAASTAVAATPSPCSSHLPASRIAEIEQLVRDEPVVIFAMRHTRCLAAASERLEGVGACFRLEGWDRRNEPLWQYMQCLHPNEIVGGMMSEFARRSIPTNAGWLARALGRPPSGCHSLTLSAMLSGPRAQSGTPSCSQCTRTSTLVASMSATASLCSSRR